MISRTDILARPRIGLRDMLTTLRHLLQKSTEMSPPRAVPQHDPWDSDGDYYPEAESTRIDSFAPAPPRPEGRLTLAATTTVDVAARLMALRVPPAAAILSGLIAGSLALLSPDEPS